LARVFSAFETDWQISLSRAPDFFAGTPAGTTGHLSSDVPTKLLRENAVHFVQFLRVETGTPVTQVIDPSALRIGAVITVLVVVVVTVMM
jgi:hypothetical protein